MRNILIEANCVYHIKKDEETTVPQCCAIGPNIITINCFKYGDDKIMYCPFLIFNTAKSTIALTDEYGNVINSNKFFRDLRMPEEEQLEKEKEWISNQNDNI